MQPSNDWDSQSIVNPLETADSFLEKDPTEYLKNLPKVSLTNRDIFSRLILYFSSFLAKESTESVSETRDVSCFQRFQTWTVFEWMRKPLFILMVISKKRQSRSFLHQQKSFLNYYTLNRRCFGTNGILLTSGIPARVGDFHTPRTPRW